MALADKHCTPTRRGTPALGDTEAGAYRAELDPQWRIDGQRLTRTWSFDDFTAALAFANRIGAVADAEAHHPDLYVSWGKLKVELYTHSIGGLTMNDFILAARIDRIRD